jgi:RNA recognition motif-containing protein
MKTIYVGNLPFRATEQDIRTLFGDYGVVQSVKMVMDRETGKPRGFCFVQMEDKDALKAIEALDGQIFQGRPLRVNEALEREKTDRPPRPPRTGDRGDRGGYNSGGFGRGDRSR